MEKKKSRYKYFVGIKDRTPVVHHGDDLIKYTDFLDKEFPNWFHFVVYDNRVEKGEKGSELARFTKDNRPTKRWL